MLRSNGKKSFSNQTKLWARPKLRLAVSFISKKIENFGRVRCKESFFQYSKTLGESDVMVRSRESIFYQETVTFLSKINVKLTDLKKSEQKYFGQ